MILAGREIPGILCNPNIQSRVKDILSLVTTVSHINSVYIAPCTFQFNIILLSPQMFSECPQVFRLQLCMSCRTVDKYATPLPSHLLNLMTVNQLVDIFEPWCSSLCSIFDRMSLYLRSEYPPQSPLLQHNLSTLHNAKDWVSHPYNSVSSTLTTATV